MRVHRRFDSLPDEARGAAVAIGNFDGVHLGHRAVVRAAAADARRLDVALGVVTFEPHPRQVLHPDRAPGRLTSFGRKAELLRALGVERLFVLPFDRRLMRLPAGAFVEEILIDRLRVKALAAGVDFRFGHRRQGDVALLAELGRAGGVAVTAVAPVEVLGGICSSTRVRACLMDGEVRAAAAILGHEFEVEGVVRPGDRRGRSIGFPTANVHPLRAGTVQPAIGVYAVRAGRRSGGQVQWHPAVANLGRRPTFDGRSIVLEVHLLDGRHELYGERLRVAFVERLRGEQRFAGIAELKAQIERDCARAREIHEALPA
ncbi:MAG TPA: bifunctional riboflavin kinase/FAD synthetase [Geminicoccaceae bacterium]|nr:bifunctional riboflavin kinase/FAD synthetase [Geminicoccaceae bacterium]